ncbi:hypothetical protein [Yinghuangia sp. YIM S10712]|jgi:hypothetical protein|uniref:hypothetical protein n=1 Tax=Yinghuangia sp. YIM S10712 TaxID=3436930 RepID=UPI003F52D000
MPKGVFYVESMPVSPEREADFHDWYQNTHLPEMAALPGVVSARRFAPTNGKGPFVTLYELEADDLDAIITEVRKAAAGFTMSDAVAMDVNPNMRVLKLIGAYDPTAGAEA